MIRARLQDIFREVFDSPDLELQDEMAPGSFELWDSVETVQIAMSIENEFGIRFSVDEVGAIKSARYLLDLIQQKTGMTEK